MSETRKLELRCPDCGSELTLDADTGAVLYHRKAKEPLAQGKDFDSLFADLEAQRSRADEIFERERAAFGDRERLLEEKFREALKRAEEDPDQGPPKRPFDLD